MPGPSLRTKEFSGQTLTADVVRLDTDAVVETGIALTEATNAKCIYTSAAMTSAPPTSGLYAVLVKDGSDLIRTYYACLLTSDTSGTVDLYDWPVDALLARGQLTVPASGNWGTHSAADVWSVATRVLTAGTNITLAKGTGVTGFNDLDAAGVRAAVGLASANLDSQLGDIAAVSYATASGVSAVEADTQDIQSRLPAALVSGRIDASVGAMASNTLTAAALASDAVSEIQSGLSTLTAAQVNAECDTALSDVGLTSAVTGRIDAAVSTRLAGSSYIAPNNAAILSGLDDLPTNAELSAAIAAISIPTATANADALLDRAAAIDGKTVREALRIISAVVAGRVSGAGTSEEVFTGLDETTTRVTVAVDSSGNRSDVTYG